MLLKKFGSFAKHINLLIFHTQFKNAQMIVVHFVDPIAVVLKANTVTAVVYN